MKKVTGLKQKEGSTSQVKLAWNKVSGATGYEIYQYHTKDKKYVMIGTTTTTSKTIGGLKPGTSYSFKVRAYKKVKGKNYYGATSSALTATTKLQRPIILSVRSKSKKAISIMLKKAPSVSGYQISVSTSKDFKNSTTMNRTTKKTTYLVTNVKSKKKYYVKVRVYKTVNNKKIFSDWSPVKAINVR